MMVIQIHDRIENPLVLILDAIDAGLGKKLPPHCIKNLLDPDF